MAVLRIDIERALDELVSQEEGMRFQGLAVALGKQRWPEFIANERKKDFGLDAYAPPNLTGERFGKGLAASITPTLAKVSTDAKTAKKNYPALKVLLFVTPAKVGNTTRSKWAKKILEDHDVDLHVLGREETIAEMMLPKNAAICASHLHLNVDAEPDVADLRDRSRRAADVVTQSWARRTKGHPLINLTAVRLDRDGAETPEELSIEEIDQALGQSSRIVLEGPAGRGKTTTLIQLAQHERRAGIPFIVDLSSWTTSQRRILDYVSGIPAFEAEGITSGDLARVQETEPFLFLLNGWNEIAESGSTQANDALKELERDFPSAGIIVATRAHHLAPPLPGATRLRLLPLRPVQRANYLALRLGTKDVDLSARIEADPSLEGLTRTPFVLSEVASLFEADAEIPSTKFGVLTEVLRLHEQREEHRHSLHAAPIWGQHMDYLKALATEMTERGAVELSERDARAVVAAIAGELADGGQIEPVGAPTVLATLTAHHVLERVDYPETTLRFEHQQLQEYCAALDLRARLLELPDDDPDATERFTADYVNRPAWDEPLRMIAETVAEQTDDDEAKVRKIRAGRKLVDMALRVDLVFAGELARLCGAAVWNEVHAVVVEHFRDAHALPDGNHQQYALTAMLATGADDFRDIIGPILSGQDRQLALRTYRYWPDIRVSSLGSRWLEQIRGWSEQARTDFVSAMLHHRVDDEVATFAAQDNSVAVKKAAVSGLMWTGSDHALVPVLESMNPQDFEDVALTNADLMPSAIRPKAIVAMRNFIERGTNHPARLRTALHLIEFGEPVPDSMLKDLMAAVPGDDMRNLGPSYIGPALAHLHGTDPAWTNEWVSNRIADGVLAGHEEWLPFAPVIPDPPLAACLHCLETEDLGDASREREQITAFIVAQADATLAAEVFSKLRELQRRADAEPGSRNRFEWQVRRQLETVFRLLSGDLVAAGVLSSVTIGDPLDIKVATDLLSRVARPDLEPLHVADDELRACLRAYLRGSVGLVLREDDFNGNEKAAMASALAQVGRPEDMADLKTVIRADIERMQRGRAARAAGDGGPLADGAFVTYAGWHVAAVTQLDRAGAEPVLIDLLSEPEYRCHAARAMACDFVPRRDGSFHGRLRYDLMWAAREALTPPLDGAERRGRFVAALQAEITRLREQSHDGTPARGLNELTSALAALDGRDSAETVLNVIAMCNRSAHSVCVDAAEHLLTAGVVLPADTTFGLLNSIAAQTAQSMNESEKHLLRRCLALCPFVDDPAAGVAKVREGLRNLRLWGYELRQLVVALGESRSEAAIDLLYELASDKQTFDQCDDEVINALVTLDRAHTGEVLLGFVDPDIRGIALTQRPHREEVLIARLAELAQQRSEVYARLRDLCERDLPEINRDILSRVMDWIGTPEALATNLKLIHDERHVPVPQGVCDQLESAFLHRRPHGQSLRVFTLHARASNELRARLLQMARDDAKRRKSAFMLLGRIELWRLEYGRPAGEPRHPDLASGQSWPPRSSDLPH